MKKRLTLTRESIADLTPSDLVGVVGAVANDSRELAMTCPLFACLQERSLRCDTTFNTC